MAVEICVEEKVCLGFANEFGFNVGKPQVLVKEEEELIQQFSTEKFGSAQKQFDTYKRQN